MIWTTQHTDWVITAVSPRWRHHRNVMTVTPDLWQHVSGGGEEVRVNDELLSCWREVSLETESADQWTSLLDLNCFIGPEPIYQTWSVHRTWTGLKDSRHTLSSDVAPTYTNMTSWRLKACWNSCRLLRTRSSGLNTTTQVVRVMMSLCHHKWGAGSSELTLKLCRQSPWCHLWSSARRSCTWCCSSTWKQQTSIRHVHRWTQAAPSLTWTEGRFQQDCSAAVST